MLSNFFFLYRTKIVVRNFNNLIHDTNLISQLRQLTVSSNSGMNYELDQMLLNYGKYGKLPTQYHALLAYLDNKLIAWALLSNERCNYNFHTSYFDPRDGTLFQVYVHPDFRRKGLGTRLIKQAQKILDNKTLCVCPWDYTSRHFFHQFNNFNYKIL